MPAARPAFFAEMLASSTEESEVRDPWVTRMVTLPAIIVSSTLEEPLDWADATLMSGDAVDVVARLKEESITSNPDPRASLSIFTVALRSGRQP